MSFDYLSFSFFVADRVIILSETTIYRQWEQTRISERIMEVSLNTACLRKNINNNLNCLLVP